MISRSQKIKLQNVREASPAYVTHPRRKSRIAITPLESETGNDKGPSQREPAFLFKDSQEMETLRNFSQTKSKFDQKELEEKFEQELADRRQRKGLSDAQRVVIQGEIDRTRARVMQIYNNTGLILNPGTELMYRWNLLVLLVVLFCIAWTPFEVAFLKISFNGLFLLNRMIDVIFFLDFLTRFFRSYQDSISGAWVRDHRKIFWHYAKGRMVLDFCLSFGCFVADIIALNFKSAGMPIAAWADTFASFRLLRVSNLFKVSALGYDVSERYSFFSGAGWTYNRLSLVKFIVIIALVVHFMGCSWRLVIKYEAHQDDFYNSWIMREGLINETPVDLYVICIYWAATTITTIGYGDVAMPGTSLERALAVIVMLCGALVWAYIIGGITAVVSSFNLEELEFYEQMDQLNQYMASKRMSLPLRERLRNFFRHRRSLEQDSGHAALMEKMSPTLRGEVARTVSQEWLKRVPWLHKGSLGFIASVAIALENELYAPRELIVGTQLRVLTRGVVAKNSRIYTSGSVWGIDIILSSSRLKNLHPARALTFAHVLSLDSMTLDELLEAYPREKARIRSSAIWLGLKRSFVNYAQQLKTGRQILNRIAEEVRIIGVDFERVFEAFDEQRRKYLTKAEFDRAIRTLGFTGPTIILDVILSRFDKDGDDAVDYIEFVEYFTKDYMHDKVHTENKATHIEYLDFKRLAAVKSLQEENPPDFEAKLRHLFAHSGSRQRRRSTARKGRFIPTRPVLIERSHPSAHMSFGSRMTGGKDLGIAEEGQDMSDHDSSGEEDGIQRLSGGEDEQVIVRTVSELRRQSTTKLFDETDESSAEVTEVPSQRAWETLQDEAVLVARPSSKAINVGVREAGQQGGAFRASQTRAKTLPSHLKTEPSSLLIKLAHASGRSIDTSMQSFDQIGEETKIEDTIERLMESKLERFREQLIEDLSDLVKSSLPKFVES